MELYSDKFKELVGCYLTAENPFIGTLSAVYDRPLIREIKQRDNIKVIEVTLENRELLREGIYSSFR